MGLPGELAQVLRTPEHMMHASSLVPKDAIASSTTCGPDVEAPHEHGGPLARREGEGLDKAALADSCLADHEDDCARATADGRVERCIERGELPVTFHER
jgi:hypothetical protein